MANGKIRYSFVIPVKEINPYVRESVPKILEIPRDDYEVLVYPDKGLETDEKWDRTRQIPGPQGPAAKRSQAMHDAKGDILVFVDDDAYPQSDLLEALDKDFSDPTVVAVGGPAVTPKDDRFLQRVSGAVFLSRFSGGFPERYVPLGDKRFVSDWPSVNLSVRKDIFKHVGGFDCDYWPGEDTKLCLDIVSKFKERSKILYDPEAVVFHHRRAGLIRHLRQVRGYGLHRGFFAKRFPETSFAFRYFVPSAFLAFVLAGLFFGLMPPGVRIIYALGWVAYAGALAKSFLDIVKHGEDLGVAAYALVYVFLTHLAYGAAFVKGFLFTNELKSKFR